MLKKGQILFFIIIASISSICGMTRNEENAVKKNTKTLVYNLTQTLKHTNINDDKSRTCVFDQYANARSIIKNHNRNQQLVRRLDIDIWCKITRLAPQHLIRIYLQEYQNTIGKVCFDDFHKTKLTTKQ